MPIQNYIKEVKKLYQGGISTEHSYRPALQIMLRELVSGITVTNEPKHQACGAPDYIIQRKTIPVGYIEAKDVGINLTATEKTEQLQRYLKSLDNLILTDYIEFRFYRYAQCVKIIQLASISNGKLIVNTENIDLLATYLQDFCDFKGQTIKSAEKLARMMAQKARMMEEVILKAVVNEDEDNTLRDQLAAFRKIIIHDMDEKAFSDVYAQTIAYGLFAARLHDPTLDTFTRQEARELIPKTNPFLRSLFDYISGADLDERIIWIVDDLAEIFRATDLPALLADFGKTTGQTDPFLHFYETFLAEYDPKLRKSRGVYYTPEPVVNFIVRAVDDILKTEFDLPKGLADNSKIKIKVDSDIQDPKSPSGFKKVEKEVHKVQILDPATGTGTFLSEIVKLIYNRYKDQQGMWSSYVEDHLIPRLNGFEILMASYTMCHLKLEMLLRDTGYKPRDERNQKRLRVFLTNSLEEAHPDTGTLFASWLSREADEANRVKRDTPVMVIIGNPPYSVSSSNKSEWIETLLRDYKKDLNERNIQPLSDDYIKFIRFGHHFIEKNGEGILAYISNNSFIDGIIHRQMRKSLLETFDKIYILDLHGNSKKKETTPDGGKDENVFDIMQGVSINLFIKTKRKIISEEKRILHIDLFGVRELKYDYLGKSFLNTISWNELKPENPNNYLVKKNFDGNKDYEKGFKINELFIEFASGLTTERDNITIQFDKEKIINIINDFNKFNTEELRKKYDNNPDGRDWKYNSAINDIKNNIGNVQQINYRPFDKRWTYYTGKTKGFMAYPRYEIMQHFIKNNVGLIVKRGFDNEKSAYGFITNALSDRRGWSSPGMQGAENIFPLYIYPDKDKPQGLLDSDRHPNLNENIVYRISNNLGSLPFVPEKEQGEDSFAPIDILDYIYAVLHSPSYREKYKEFLKIDFPRVPYPQDRVLFWQLVKLGGELRQIHLLESPVVHNFITTFPASGNNEVTKIIYESGNVYINPEQYFGNVPEIAWNFYIGGYQPAQKWLKDRKSRTLTSDDIEHYQKIIVALTETDRIMREIDSVFI